MEKKKAKIFLSLEEPVKEDFLVYEIGVNEKTSWSLLVLSALIKNSGHETFTLRIPFSIRVFGVKVRGSLPIKGKLRYEIDGESGI